MRLGEAELWWIADLGEADPAPLRHLLSAEALARIDRQLHAADQRSTTAAHALLQTRLRQSPGVTPQLQHDSAGRPWLAGAEQDLRVSLSHTRGAAACLLTCGVACGVDIEATAPLPELQSLARRVLAPEEWERYCGLAADARLERFYRLWSLKEAWSKALGLGLAAELRAIAFDVDDPARVRVLAALDAETKAWHFTSQVVPHACLAAALRPDGALAVALRIRSVPWRDLVHGTH